MNQILPDDRLQTHATRLESEIRDGDLANCEDQIRQLHADLASERSRGAAVVAALAARIQKLQLDLDTEVYASKRRIATYRAAYGALIGLTYDLSHDDAKATLDYVAGAVHKVTAERDDALARVADLEQSLLAVHKVTAERDDALARVVDLEQNMRA